MKIIFIQGSVTIIEIIIIYYDYCSNYHDKNCNVFIIFVLSVSIFLQGSSVL
jgi:hypothetical protein